ncbi:hypothetical protein PPERSA_04325 [Pseudocohnilembus persalinus]|uniref:Uncharacterized protein n=1 Tax=Pseudocohnilembus persalinus TaxID=266149 RepID=A0A0V0QQD2_PSEPJ|nr:hypothetical protein PPERSA_04325 [Pseudocohnilembus persalinus]|eukprot:KRX04510.1 hypothetical protein PPERSA_04325 [Pseudocohnilembus persalinus]
MILDEQKKQEREKKIQEENKRKLLLKQYDQRPLPIDQEYVQQNDEFNSFVKNELQQQKVQQQKEIENKEKPFSKKALEFIQPSEETQNNQLREQIKAQIEDEQEEINQEIGILRYSPLKDRPNYWKNSEEYKAAEYEKKKKNFAMKSSLLSSQSPQRKQKNKNQHSNFRMSIQQGSLNMGKTYTDYLQKNNQFYNCNNLNNTNNLYSTNRSLFQNTVQKSTINDSIQNSLNFTNNSNLGNNQLMNQTRGSVQTAPNFQKSLTRTYKYGSQWANEDFQTSMLNTDLKEGKFNKKILEAQQQYMQNFDQRKYQLQRSLLRSQQGTQSVNLSNTNNSNNLFNIQINKMPKNYNNRKSNLSTNFNKSSTNGQMDINLQNFKFNQPNPYQNYNNQSLLQSTGGHSQKPSSSAFHKKKNQKPKQITFRQDVL